MNINKPLIALMIAAGAAFAQDTPSWVSTDDHLWRENDSPTSTSQIVPLVPLPPEDRPTMYRGALSGIIVYSGAGHGFTSDIADTHPKDGEKTWYTQRGLNFGMVEDFGNIDQLNFFAEYALRAGATVVPTRPLGFQLNEVVIDNDGPNVTFTGEWFDSKSTIYYGEAGDVPYRYAAASATETATARYTATIPEAGYYPVYAWARPGDDRTNQLYRVYYSGGMREMRINHRRVGRGWIWLGTYYFNAGESGVVEISNQDPNPPANRVVIADAVRFGNGIGDIDRGAGVSGYPREFEASRYWIERMIGQGGNVSVFDLGGLDDQDDNVGAPSRMGSVMNRDVEGDYFDRLHLSFHTNASGNVRGALGLFNGRFPTRLQQEYAGFLHDETDKDLEALDEGVAFPGDWNDNGGRLYGGTNYGELRNSSVNGEFTATILEVAYHDKPLDAALMVLPKVREIVGRASTQGIIRFLNETRGEAVVPLVFSPDPPTHVCAVVEGDAIKLSWLPSPVDGIGGDAPDQFIVVRSKDGTAFGEPMVYDGGERTFARVSDLRPGEGVYLRVIARNKGGESLPSKAVYVRLPETQSSVRVLVVDATDPYDPSLLPTISAAENLGSTKGGGGTVRILRTVAQYDPEALRTNINALPANVAIETASSESVFDGLVKLNAYDAVVWMSRNLAPNTPGFARERDFIQSYMENKGRLIVTGGPVRWNLGRELQFKYILKPTDVRERNQTATILSARGTIFEGVPPFTVSFLNGDIFGPNVSMTSEGAVPALQQFRDVARHVSSLGGYAGVQAEMGNARLVNIAYPLRTIKEEGARAELMRRAIAYVTGN